MDRGSERCHRVWVGDPPSLKTMGGQGCVGWHRAVHECPLKEGFPVRLGIESSLFIYLLVALGLHCFAWAFSSCGEMGLLFIVVHRLLDVMASLVWSTGSRHTGFSSYNTRAQLHRGMWDPPRPGICPLH